MKGQGRLQLYSNADLINAYLHIHTSLKTKQSLTFMRTTRFCVCLKKINRTLPRPYKNTGGNVEVNTNIAGSSDKATSTLCNMEKEARLSRFLKSRNTNIKKANLRTKLKDRLQQCRGELLSHSSFHLSVQLKEINAYGLEMQGGAL